MKNMKCADCGAESDDPNEKVCATCGGTMEEVEPMKNSDYVMCRASVVLPVSADNEIMYLPGGEHAITPFGGGVGKPINVHVDHVAASEIERERSAIDKRKAPYFDFNHEDGKASFWPKRFFWRDGTQPGVYAQGEWSSSGKDAVVGKEYRYFSPVFYVDNKHADKAKVVCRETAPPNMGGLTNDPAFHNILPLWAKSAGDADKNTLEHPATKPTKKKEETEMTTEEVAALQAKQTELEKKIEDLTSVIAKHANENASEETVAAAEAELRATESELKAAKAEARIEEQNTIIAKRSKTDAQAAIKRLIMRGGIAPKDTRGQEALMARMIADPSFIGIVDNINPGGNGLDTRITSRGTIAAVKVGNEDPMRIYSQMARILASSQRASREDRSKLSREFAALYATEFQGEQGGRLMGFPVSELETAIQAADVTDGNLGTLAGVLVTQRTLELLKLTFPSLTAFTTDFSDQPATFGQTLMTRTITIPAVSDYNTSTGWADATAATADVPVTLNKHQGVTITFNEQILANSVRHLFDEFAPASAYALAKSLVDNLYANITDANFTNNTVQATSTFARANVVSLGTQLTLRGVPLGLGMRTLLIYPTVFEKLVTDTALITFAAYQKPEIITAPQSGASLVIPVDTFNVINSPNLPTNNGNVTGFAGSRSALCIVTRTPNDYTSVLPGASFGNVQMVTDPDIGITVMLAQYVNHTLGRASSRIALMYGTAAGQGSAGQLLKAASGSGSSRA